MAVLPKNQKVKVKASSLVLGETDRQTNKQTNRNYKENNVCVCACVRVYACVYACVRACVLACVRACVRVCVWLKTAQEALLSRACGADSVCVKFSVILWHKARALPIRYRGATRGTGGHSIETRDVSIRWLQSQ